MPIDITPLRKILELEHKKDYADTAVFGGLDGFLARWTLKEEGGITDSALLKRFRKLPKINYAALTREQRRRQVEYILNFISELEQASPVQKSKAPAPKKKKMPASKPKPAATPANASFDSSITAVKGISSSLASRFAKLGVYTIRDLLYFFPRRHLDYSRLKKIAELEEGSEESIIANIWQVKEVRLGGRRSTEAIVGDDTGNVRVVWFNNPYLVKQLDTDKQLVISGRVGIFKGMPVFQSPEWEVLEDSELTHTGRLAPLYPLTRGLYPRQVRRLMKAFIDEWADRAVEFLPADIRQSCNLLELPQAIYQAHFPDDESMKDNARKRLAFDELFLLQLGVLARKQRWQQQQSTNPFGETPLLQKWTDSLPFALTAAQQRVIKEILADLKKNPADVPPSARRSGQRQDGGGCRRAADGGGQRLPGGFYGSH